MPDINHITRYLLDNLFVTSLQTLAFFIVAHKYDKLQRRRSFLKEFKKTFLLKELNYIGKDWSVFSQDVEILWSESSSVGLFNGKLKFDLHIFFILIIVKTKGSSLFNSKEDRIIKQKDLFVLDLFAQDIQYFSEKIRRKCKWTGFTNFFLPLLKRGSGS